MRAPLKSKQIENLAEKIIFTHLLSSCKSVRPVFPSICLPIHMLAYAYVILSYYLSVHPYADPYIFPQNCLSVYLFVFLEVHLSIYVYVCSIACLLVSISWRLSFAN